VGITEFDYDEIDRRLRAAMKETSYDPIRGWTQDNVEVASEMLRELLVWVCDGRDLHTMGLRFLAMALAIRPGLFPDGHMSVVARSYGLHKQSLGRQASAFFKIADGRFIHGYLHSSNAQRHKRRVAARAKGLRARNGHVEVAPDPEKLATAPAMP